MSFIKELLTAFTPMQLLVFVLLLMLIKATKWLLPTKVANYLPA